MWLLGKFQMIVRFAEQCILGKNCQTVTKKMFGQFFLVCSAVQFSAMHCSIVLCSAVQCRHVCQIAPKSFSIHMQNDLCTLHMQNSLVIQHIGNKVHILCLECFVLIVQFCVYSVQCVVCSVKGGMEIARCSLDCYCPKYSTILKQPFQLKILFTQISALHRKAQSIICLLVFLRYVLPYVSSDDSPVSILHHTFCN